MGTEHNGAVSGDPSHEPQAVIILPEIARNLLVTKYGIHINSQNEGAQINLASGVVAVASLSTNDSLEARTISQLMGIASMPDRDDVYSIWIGDIPEDIKSLTGDHLISIRDGATGAELVESVTKGLNIVVNGGVLLTFPQRGEEDKDFREGVGRQLIGLFGRQDFHPEQTLLVFVYSDEAKRNSTLNVISSSRGNLRQIFPNGIAQNADPREISAAIGQRYYTWRGSVAK